MNTQSTIIRFLFGVVMFTALTGCATPPSINNLARKTSDNMIDLALALENFKNSSNAQVDRGAIRIARQISSIDEERLVMERKIDLARRAGKGDVVKRIDDIKSLADEWARKEVKKKEKNMEKREAILEGQVTLETQATALRETGGQLLELSKEDSAKSRAEFLIGFAKDVANEVEKARKDAEKKAESEESSEEGGASNPQ